MAKIGGVDSIRIDNLSPKVGDSCNLTVNTATRESVTGLTGDAGYRETHRPARVEFQILDDGTVDLTALLAKTNATVTVVTSSKTHVIRNARQVEDVDLDQAAGTYSVVFEGPEYRAF